MPVPLPLPMPMPVPAETTTVVLQQSLTSSTLLSSSNSGSTNSQVSDDKLGKALLLKSLEQETKAAEKLAQQDERRARAELKREKFFEYDARQAALAERRMEQAEQKAIDEAIRDKKELQRLQALERRMGLDEASTNNQSLTKQEKDLRLREAKKLRDAERALRKKELEAERAERVFLAEEIQEQKLLQQKIDAERREKAKFESAEKEYERAKKDAEEDEAELRLAKKLFVNRN